MRLVKGTDLTDRQCREVLSSFVYRRTHPVYRMHTGDTADSEWLRLYAFYIRVDGRLSVRYGHCEPAYMAD